ncbi:hypothetical protein [Rhizobium sp. Root483D2]|uniref:hypothetical protein n=1 Tax=Rhizobium sp. Root483D2 TaxID=1736545 RepID=UPI0007129175|nr:hypothetical protein [Rhizobium sp. Root483D2]KQY25931.1 hypothetical protein ASD32_25970 [Rhizobium sp. Root483D2]
MHNVQAGDPADEVRRLRALHVSVNDIARQTGTTVFEVYEISEGRGVAIEKLARLHEVRGIGWPWDEMAHDPDVQQEPSTVAAINAVRAIIDLFRGTSLENPIRLALDALPIEERKRLVEIGTRIVQRTVNE